MQKLALCIGINDYPGTANDLSGCVNDARDFKEYLEGIGFSVTLLLDSQATRARIKNELSNMLRLNPDIAVVTDSSHGTQTPDIDGDEITDKYDEAFYVYDGMIIDDEIREIIDRDKSPKTSLIFIVDACFSKSVTRFQIGQKPKFIFNPNVPVYAKHRKKMLAGQRISATELPEIVWNGCNQDSGSNYCYDASFGGRANGAFSYYALKSLKMAPDKSWAWHQNNIERWLPSNRYPQKPALEGTEEHKNTPVFMPFDQNNETPAPEPESPPIMNWCGCLRYARLRKLRKQRKNSN